MIIAGIPAFNEEHTIAKVIVECRSHVDKIIICDDGSTDLTAEIAAAMGAEVVRHERNFGYGEAIKSIFERALKQRIILEPVADMKDIAESIQLESRGFWTKMEHPELGATVTYPGTFAKLSRGKCGIRQRAPLIGEHNKEIFEEELGLSRERVIMLKQIGVI